MKNFERIFVLFVVFICGNCSAAITNSRTLGNNACPPIKAGPGVLVECKNPHSTLVHDCTNLIQLGTIVNYKCQKYYRSTFGNKPRLPLNCTEYGRWSRIMAFEEFSCTPDCGNPIKRHKPLIVFGEETGRTSWPWHASIYILYAKNSKEAPTPIYACGGSLIEPSLVLTVAHCLAKNDKVLRAVDTMIIVLGAVSSNFTLNQEDENVQIRRVKRTYISDEYDTRELQSDIGLIELAEPVELSDFVSPVCFPYILSDEMSMVELNFDPGTTGEVVGFGHTENGIISPTLKYTRLPVVSRKECWESLEKIPNNSQFCAGTRNGTTVCNGDSGGGMVFEEIASFSRRYFIQGIVSFGEWKAKKTTSCQNYAVFTKVYKFANWVYEIRDQIYRGTIDYENFGESNFTLISSTTTMAPPTTPISTKPVPEQASTVQTPYSLDFDSISVEVASRGVTIADPKPRPITYLGGEYDYNQVLRKSILFYEAQRSGRLPLSNRIHWRGDSMLQDKGLKGEDLTGGYYNGGDTLKMGFPAAAMTTVLAWGLLDFKRGYEIAGEFENGLAALKWSTDFIIKAHPSALIYYIQVGNEEEDHNHWGRAEDWPKNKLRRALRITKNAPGSDIAAEASAALTASSMVFANAGMKSYATECLRHALELYQFANTYRGVYSDSVREVPRYYQSYSGYGDELGWAAAWLYRATFKMEYKNELERHWKEFNLGQTPWEFSWDQKTAGIHTLMARVDGSAKYVNATRGFCDWVSMHAPKTPKGLLVLGEYGSLRYAGNAAFICTQAAIIGIENERYLEFARSQINYILGSSGRSFVAGYGVNPPVRIHHAASSCRPKPAKCDWEDYEKRFPNHYVLEGAMVGGPDKLDQYSDNRTNNVQNEVTLDYNAGFQSALAGLIQIKWKEQDDLLKLFAKISSQFSMDSISRVRSLSP